MTIKEALEFGNYSLGAEVLLCHILKKNKTWLYSHQFNILSSYRTRRYQKLIFRCKKGEPIAYLTHHKEFYGLDFYVDESVLIPRPETELLVEEALKFAKKKMKIIDIGTGSGNIIISIIVNSKQLTDNKYYATDISRDALKIARKNAKKHKVLSKIKFIRSNLFSNLKNLKFDLIIANLPYLDPGWINNELKYEPRKALDGGRDGVIIIKKFLQQAKNHLNKKSTILLEIDPSQTKLIKKLVKKYLPDKKITIKKDLTVLDRVAILN